MAAYQQLDEGLFGTKPNYLLQAIQPEAVATNNNWTYQSTPQQSYMREALGLDTKDQDESRLEELRRAQRWQQMMQQGGE